MMQLSCPYCGPRNVSEFNYGGEVIARPEVGSVTPGEWREYLYIRSNPAGWTREKWYHGTGCRQFFQTDRNTLTNETRAVEEAR